MDISKLYGSLARRIVGVLLILVVAPLVVDGFFLVRRDKLIKNQAAENQLALMGKTFQIYLDQFVGSSLKKLENDLEMRGERSWFVFDEKGVCTRSSNEDMRGEENFFRSEIQRAFREGRGLFIGLNPYSLVEELFVFLRVGKELRGLSVSQARFVEPLNKALDPFKFALSSGEDKVSGQITSKKPAPDTNFSLEVSISKVAVSRFEGGAVYRHLFWLLGTIVVLGGVGTVWLIRKMATPLHELTKVMQRVGDQDFTPRYRVQPFGFEINALGMLFNDTLESLLVHMKEANDQRIKKELLGQQLRIGQAVQKELLPKEIPKFPGIQMESLFISAKEVAGDFFDAFPISKEEMFFVIADASDKGISACLYSLIIRSMLRSHAVAAESLSSIVQLTNNLFLQDTKDSGNFVTAWLGILNVRTNTLTYASAGHIPAILMNEKGELAELTTQGIAFGVSEVASVAVGTKILPPKSQLFLYTDGVLDAQNEKGELFGKSRLINFLKTSSSLEPDSLVDGLMKEIKGFSRASEPYDDLTVLILKPLSNSRSRT